MYGHGHDNVVNTFIEADIDVNIRNGADSKWTGQPSSMLHITTRSPVSKYFLIMEQRKEREELIGAMKTLERFAKISKRSRRCRHAYQVNS